MKQPVEEKEPKDRRQVEDGDTRPDTQGDENIERTHRLNQDKRKISKERGADTDSLEDFKDAK